jgi:hypothetical protein
MHAIWIMNIVVWIILVSIWLWWKIDGKAKHYRKVIAWSEMAGCEHPEYKKAKEYFQSKIDARSLK